MEHRLAFYYMYTVQNDLISTATQLLSVLGQEFRTSSRLEMCFTTEQVLISLSTWIFREKKIMNQAMER